MSSDMHRRDFVRTLSGSAAAIVAGGSLEGCVAAASPRASVAAAPARTWDMSWLKRVNAPYRIVFDVTQTNGMALWQAATWMEGHAMASGAKDSDLNAVLVFRHDAVTAVLDEPMRKRLGVAAPAHTDGPSLATLMGRGVIILACNNALGGQVYSLKQKEGITQDAADEAIHAAVIPGVYVMPNGIFSVGRAQDAGCGYFKPG